MAENFPELMKNMNQLADRKKEMEVKFFFFKSTSMVIIIKWSMTKGYRRS